MVAQLAVREDWTAACEGRLVIRECTWCAADLAVPVSHSDLHCSECGHPT